MIEEDNLSARVETTLSLVDAIFRQQGPIYYINLKMKDACQFAERSAYFDELVHESVAKAENEFQRHREKQKLYLKLVEIMVSWYSKLIKVYKNRCDTKYSWNKGLTESEIHTKLYRKKVRELKKLKITKN